MILVTAAIFAAVTTASITLIPAVAQQSSANELSGQIDQGKTTYAKNCSHCHGPNLINSGTITPDLRAFPDDKTRFVTTVKQGKNGKMPPWADILSEQEIADVWAFVSSRRNP
ncbi:c-type cytochrome [Bradyrhizobium jicamae]|uniref:C-type cytochrome n=1 Tax=Bradyrhizobium jicamae TaxID=280332 RepID=A0ABS5FGM4_9BRAD|nr:c-type cytochrome [Bradyrhizobium jicamae]MBR0795937.1 c-type cytochrome [Bradyrhizobium jicamae]MBR0935621.1 c-type cytochrome [Bradyrhizobium jicamae]